MDSVSGSIGEIIRYALPDDYYRTYPAKVRFDAAAGVRRRAKVIRPDNLVWIVVGDRSKMEAAVRELGFGEIRLIDPDGNPIQ